MTRFIFTCIILFTTHVTFAQTETNYVPPMPFSQYANSYQYSIQKLYESLPKVEDNRNVTGTRALVEAELKNILSGTVKWQEGNTVWRGDNLLPIGKQRIEVRRLTPNRYFWCIYGQVQLFTKRSMLVETNPKPPIRTVQNYCIILHFKDSNAKAHIDFFTIGATLITNNTQTLNTISKEATELLTKANKEAYGKVKVKNEWTINDKTVSGTFDKYQKGIVALTKDDGKKIAFFIPTFSYEDQLLIRGYLDHQGISIQGQ